MLELIYYLHLYSGFVQGAAGNCRRDTVQNRAQNPETCSQVSKGDNQSHRGCGALQRSIARAPCLKVQRVVGNCSGTMSKATCVKIQGVVGNCNERLRFNFRRPGWTTVTCTSQIMGTLRKFSRIFVESCIERRMMRCLI